MKQFIDLTKFATDKMKFKAIQEFLNSMMNYQDQIVLKDESTINWDVSNRYNAKVTLAGSRTLNISGMRAGTYGTIEIVQGGSGSYTLTLPAGSKVANGGAGALTLSTSVGAIDVATFYYTGSTFYWTLSTDFS